MIPISEEEKAACQSEGRPLGSAWVLRRPDELRLYRPPPSGAHRRRLQRIILGMCSLIPVSFLVFLIEGAPKDLWIIGPGLLVLAVGGWLGWQSLAQWSSLRINKDGFILSFSKRGGRPPLTVQGRLEALKPLHRSRTRQNTIISLDTPLLSSRPPITEGDGQAFDQEVDAIQRWLESLRHSSTTDTE